MLNMQCVKLFYNFEKSTKFNFWIKFTSIPFEHCIKKAIEQLMSLFYMQNSEAGYSFRGKKFISLYELEMILLCFISW